jgi:hypothetical protein
MTMVSNSASSESSRKCSNKNELTKLLCCVYASVCPGLHGPHASYLSTNWACETNSSLANLVRLLGRNPVSLEITMPSSREICVIDCRVTTPLLIGHTTHAGILLGEGGRMSVIPQTSSDGEPVKLMCPAQRITTSSALGFMCLDIAAHGLVRTKRKARMH